jgi:hypothetical protein
VRPKNINFSQQVKGFQVGGKHQARESSHTMKAKRKKEEHLNASKIFLYFQRDEGKM